MNTIDQQLFINHQQDPLLFQQAEDSSLFTDLFKDPSLDQLLNSVCQSPLSSPNSSSASETSSDSPPTALLNDAFLDDFLTSPTPMPAVDMDMVYQFDALESFIKAEDIKSQQEQELVTNEEFSPSFQTLPAPQEETPKPATSPRPKKNHLVGQSTMSIKITTQKSLRPSRKLECFNCKVTKTPLWRRTPDRLHSLCNACGLYYKQYNSHRPLHVRNKTHTIRAHPYANERVMNIPKPASPPLVPLQPVAPTPSEETSASAVSGQECANCHQTQTPLWRKNDRGEPVCNACGLYAKLHHRDRPAEMRKTTIQRRRRDWTQEDISQPDQLEEEDTRFVSLLLQMNRDQMHGFLGMLERRCDFLKTVLATGGEQE